MWQQLKSTRFFKIFTNRYLVTVLAFVVWMAFFDKNNVIDQTERRVKLYKLRQKEQFYTQRINDIDKQKTELFSTPETMEKFAREKYFMKKDNEDVYIINTHNDK